MGEPVPEVYYDCPAHPGPTYPRAGKCPRCGSALVPAHLHALRDGPWFYCPDHPKVQSTGRGCCLRCGRELEPVETGKEAP